MLTSASPSAMPERNTRLVPRHVSGPARTRATRTRSSVITNVFGDVTAHLDSSTTRLLMESVFLRTRVLVSTTTRNTNRVRY